ncbi:MAG: heavy metal sensor histidine kinase [Rubrivivax sp.]
MSRGPSVGRQLSAWLALQGLVGSTIVCTIVFVDARASLSARQGEALANKRVQIQHLMQEARDDVDIERLKHKLDDFFVGHDEMSLELGSRSGAIVYASATRPASAPPRERSVIFEVPRLRAAGDLATATLHLDIRDDDLLLRRLTWTLVLAAFATSALASLTGYLLVHTGLGPIHHLARQARKLGADTLYRRLDDHDQPEELRPLVAQFNALLQRLDHAYTQLEAFNSDVAHELCTPLATLISSSEVALRRARNGAELEDVIGSNLEELRRLADIVRDMLFLSRADRGVRARRVHAQSLAEIAAAVGEYHEAAADAAGLRLQILGDAQGWFDVPLLRRALSNLLVNATRYANAGSTVDIIIAPTADLTGLRLSVRNDGPEIGADDLPRIFDRFYRADKARSAGHENHGLGLAIVAAIARMHGGQVFANSAQGSTEVGLLLPLPGTADTAAS